MDEVLYLKESHNSMRYFLFLVMNFLFYITLPQLSKSNIYYLKIDQFKKGDYYFFENYTIILLSGIYDKTMKFLFLSLTMLGTTVNLPIFIKRLDKGLVMEKN